MITNPLKNIATLCLLLAPFTGLLAADAPAPARKPNIIFILVDDLGLPGFGCTGGIYKTPNIDALAATGIRFETCYAAPLCGPSRAMLMTGRYAFRTGMVGNGGGKNVTMEKDGCVAQLMRQAGYATAIAGKWRQLRYFTSKADGTKWGWDEFLIWGQGDPADADNAAAKKPKGDGEEHDRYWNPGYNLNGKTLQGAEGKFGPDLLNDFVLDFIRRNKDKPFFIYYPTPLIHSQLERTPDMPEGGEKQKGMGKENNLYGQNIKYIDKQIGLLVAELDRWKLRENTLIVVTGDNGSAGGVPTVNGRKVDGHKGTMLEGGSRVPLIANWPGVTPAGGVRKDLIDFTDMLPTFAAVAGAPLPAGRVIDGHSFAPQLRGQPGQPRDWAYTQLNDDRYVRDARWKLTGNGELFDMKDAPYAQIPVPAASPDPEAKAARAKLQAVLDTLRDDTAKKEIKQKK